MKETANFGLKKPEENDFYDFETQNENMDEIDRVLQEYKIEIKTVATTILTYNDITVSVTDWVPDTTYTSYPYKADIVCDGVTADYKPEVTFDVTEAISGVYAPVANTSMGLVSIYANEIPKDTITIPTITFIKAVSV